MSISTTYTAARENLARLCDEVADNKEVVIITRRGAADVALVAADELSSLMETAHLLRSSRNAKRLLTALDRAKTRSLKPKDAASLRQEMGVGKSH